MTIIQFNPNNIVEPIKQPKDNSSQYFSYDYPEDSFEFEDFDLDEFEEPVKSRKTKSLEIKNQKERRKLLSQAWAVYYRPIQELDKIDPKAYWEKSYSCEKDNHFEISKYSGKNLFGTYSTKEVFVFKNNAPVFYSKYKLSYSYQGHDSEGLLFGLNEKRIATCDFLK